jgi:hypothetical protein
MLLQKRIILTLFDAFRTLVRNDTGYKVSLGENFRVRGAQIIPHNKVKLKVKVKSLYLTKHHAMNTFRGSGVIAPRILDLGNRWR